MKLITFHTLFSSTVNKDVNIFVGLTNMLNDAKIWVWYGGNKTEYTYWADGQPITADR